MKKYALTGIILVVTGIVVFVYQGISYVTGHKFIGMGSMHMAADISKTLPLPTIIGAVTLVGGIVLLIRVSMKN